MEQGDNLTLMIQASANSDPVNKRAISKIDNMEVHEGVSNKRIKMHSQGEMVILDEQNLSDSKKNVLFEQKPAHIQHYSILDNEKTESKYLYKSKFDLILSYVEKKNQSFDETQILFPQVRKLTGEKVSLVSNKDLERNTLKFAVVSD